MTGPPQVLLAKRTKPVNSRAPEAAAKPSSWLSGENTQAEVERLQFYFDSMKDGVFCFEFTPPLPLKSQVDDLVVGMLGSKCVLANEAYAHLHRKNLQEIVGMSASEIAEPCEFNWASIRRVLDPKNHKAQHDVTTIDKDGEGGQIWLRSKIEIESSDGILYRIWGACHNLTPVKSQELAEIAKANSLSNAQNVLISGLRALALARFPDTENAQIRSGEYVKILCDALRKDSRFRHGLAHPHTALICFSAPLHDIGMAGLPDNLSFDADPSARDLALLRTHPELGRRVVDSAEDALEGGDSFLRHARDITLYHHENWDGTGFPEGLKGVEIPLSARMVALAQAFDLCIFPKNGNPSLDFYYARSQIIKGSGRAFEPAIVAAFLINEKAFADIAYSFPDD